MILWGKGSSGKRGGRGIYHVYTCKTLDDELSLTTPPPLHQQKAKKKPLAKLTPQELGVDVAPRLSVLSVEDPPTREAGSKVADVDELITKLKDVGVI